MATMLIALNEATLHHLLVDARAQGVRLEDHIEKILGRVAKGHGPATMTMEAALKLALERARQKRTSGARFSPQDLFDHAEWSRIPSRTVFGRKFRKAVEEAQVAKHVGKTAQNQAIYEWK